MAIHASNPVVTRALLVSVLLLGVAGLLGGCGGDDSDSSDVSGTGGAPGGTGGLETGGASPGVTGSSGGATSGDNGSGTNAGGTTGGSGGTTGGSGGTTDGSGGTNTGGGDGLPALHVDGNAIKDPQGNTVILRGVAMVDLGSVDEWYGGAFEMIDRLTNATDSAGSSSGWGTRVIRIPVYPADSPEVDSPNTFQADSDSFYDGLLRPVIDYCAEKGVYAIIDWHYIDTTTSHGATTSAFWTYIAPRFAGDSHVLFELYNEPINNGDWTSVRSDMQTWYDIVRDGAPDNLVLVGTPNWCQNVGASATDPVGGTNVAYTAHMYPMHWASASLQQEIVTAAAAHPVFVSEWGFEQNSNEVVDGTMSSYGAPFKAFVEQQGVSWTAWVASYDWFPSMYDPGWVLAGGEGRMGEFTKDWLWEKRDSDQPQH